MVVETIGLRNFRPFRDASLDLRKLTLLVGPNSSGKSSLIYGLLGVIQSNSFPLFFSPNGEYVNMGDFDSLSYRHRKTADIGVSLVIKGSRREAEVTIDAVYQRDPSTQLPVLKSADIDGFGLHVSIKRSRTYRAQWTYERPDDSLASRAARNEATREFFNALAKLTSSVEAGGRGARGRGAKRVATVGFEPEARAQHGRFEFADPRGYNDAWHGGARQKGPSFEVTNAFMQQQTMSSGLESRINYIGSFRHAPLRTYYQVSRAAMKVGRYGENTVEQIAEWEHLRDPRHAELTKSLKELTLLTELRTPRLRGGRFEATGRARGSSARASLADIGFGVSQFLPVIVADLQLEPGSLLMVSQPELHLHPSAQAAMANYFAEKIAKGRQYIIETHSEYLLNRIRLLIVDGKLQEDDVRVAYFENTGRSTTIRDVRFLKDGRIENAPREYFKTYMVDVMNIAMKA
jgi:predicted ATPase